GWGENGMLVSETEQLEHEYFYRTRRVMQSQQPQWLADNTYSVNGTSIPLSWNQQLNWLGGIPNAPGAIANFYRTNTASRTITLAAASLATLPLAVTPSGSGILIFTTTQQLPALTVGSGSRISPSPGNNKILVTNTFSPTGGRLDIADNRLIVDYSPATPIAS